jgi:hypothetical protein
MRHEGTRDLPVDLIDDHPRNPRKGNVAATVRALRANGQHRSIVAREHAGRYVALVDYAVAAAARKLDWPTVRADVITCTDDQADKIVVSDYGTARAATYDDAQLLAVLQAAGDLEGTGYDPADLDAIAADVHPADTPAAAPAADTGTRTETNYAERQPAYEAKGSRAFVLEYQLDTFRWVTDRFKDLRELTGAATNAEALVGALILMTGGAPPD